MDWILALVGGVSSPERIRGWRGLVRVAPEKSGCAKRPPKGVSPNFFTADTGPAAGLLADLTSRSARGDSLIFVRHHHGDGGLRVVNVERAAGGNQLHELGAAVVVADVEGDGDAVGSGTTAGDGKFGHPDDVPEAASLVLAGHAVGDGNVSIKDGAREIYRELDSRLSGGGGDFDLAAVGDGLLARVGVDDWPKVRAVLAII